MIILVLLVTLLIVFLYVEYKRIKNVTDYILYWLIIIIFLSPMIIYYVDIYNIPTKLGLIKEGDPTRWFEFTETYLSTIVGTLVSSLIVILTVLKQIKSQNDSSKEDKRIENAPLIKYYIKNEHEQTEKQDFIFNSEGKIYNIFFGVENIGLNHARHIEIIVSCDEEKWSRTFKIRNEQSLLKKDEIYWFDFVINYKKKSQKNKKLNILISYYDMLNNRYEQKIHVDYSVSDELRVESRGLKIYFNNIDIKDEELIKG